MAVCASYARFAIIIRARIVVGARQGWAGLTDSGLTGVRDGTQVTVIARCIVQGMDTARNKSAGIIGAGVIIVTRDDLSGLTPAIPAVVSVRTSIAVGADSFIGREDASFVFVTGIIGAGIEVIADFGGCPCTDAAVADIYERAGIPVTAGINIERMVTATVRSATVIGAGIVVITV